MARAMAWTRTVVPMTGASTQLIAANRRRRALTILNPSGNDDVAYDISGGAVSLDTGFPLAAKEVDERDGDDCPRGAVTCIGTNGQDVVVWEGVPV